MPKGGVRGTLKDYQKRAKDRYMEGKKTLQIVMEVQEIEAVKAFCVKNALTLRECILSGIGFKSDKKEPG